MRRIFVQCQQDKFSSNPSDRHSDCAANRLRYPIAVCLFGFNPDKNQLFGKTIGQVGPCQGGEQAIDGRILTGDPGRMLPEDMAIPDMQAAGNARQAQGSDDDGQIRLIQQAARETGVIPQIGDVDGAADDGADRRLCTLS